MLLFTVFSGYFRDHTMPYDAPKMQKNPVFAGGFENAVALQAPQENVFKKNA